MAHRAPVTSRWEITNNGLLGTKPDGRPIALTGTAVWTLETESYDDADSNAPQFMNANTQNPATAPAPLFSPTRSRFRSHSSGSACQTIVDIKFPAGIRTNRLSVDHRDRRRVPHRFLGGEAPVRGRRYSVALEPRYLVGQEPEYPHRDRHRRHPGRKPATTGRCKGPGVAGIRIQPW